MDYFYICSVFGQLGTRQFNYLLNSLQNHHLGKFRAEQHILGVCTISAGSANCVVVCGEP